MWSQQLRSSGAEGQAHPGVRQPGKKAALAPRQRGERARLCGTQSSRFSGKTRAPATLECSRRATRQGCQAGGQLSPPAGRVRAASPRPRHRPGPASQRTPNAQNPSRGWGAHSAAVEGVSVHRTPSIRWEGETKLLLELSHTAGTRTHAQIRPHGHACVCTDIYTRVCVHRGRYRFPYKPLTLPAG